jgi:hypothetical protein
MVLKDVVKILGKDSPTFNVIGGSTAVTGTYFFNAGRSKPTLKKTDDSAWIRTCPDQVEIRKERPFKPWFDDSRKKQPAAELQEQNVENVELLIFVDAAAPADFGQSLPAVMPDSPIFV